MVLPLLTSNKQMPAGISMVGVRVALKAFRKPTNLRRFLQKFNFEILSISVKLRNTEMWYLKPASIFKPLKLEQSPK